MFLIFRQASLMLLSLHISIYFFASPVWSRPQISSSVEENDNVANISTPSAVLKTGTPRSNTSFGQTENHSATSFCSLQRGSCVFSASRDNASFNQDNNTLCHRELHGLQRLGEKGSDGQITSDSLTILFLESCPSGYEDTTIARQCEISLGDETTLDLIQIVPVISYFENVTFMFKNVFCAICHEFTSFSDLSLTFSCPEGTELYSAEQGHHVSRLIRQCTTSVSVATSLGRSVFPFSISPGRGILADKVDRDGFHEDSPEQCETLAVSCLHRGGCACSRSTLQLYNCIQKAAGSVGKLNQSNGRAQEASGSTGNIDTNMATHQRKAANVNEEALFSEGENAEKQMKTVSSDDENTNNQTETKSSGDGIANNQTESLSSGDENTKDPEKHGGMEIINDDHQQLVENLHGDIEASKNTMVSENPPQNSIDGESRTSTTELVVIMVDNEENDSQVNSDMENRLNFPYCFSF